MADPRMLSTPSASRLPPRSASKDEDSLSRRLSTLSDDNLAVEEDRLKEHSRWLKSQMAKVDCIALSSSPPLPTQPKEERRTPLSSIQNTPRTTKRKQRKLRKSHGTPGSTSGTPSETRGAIDAVLAAVSDVLIMEATIQESESPLKETPPQPPSIWHQVVSSLTGRFMTTPQVVTRIAPDQHTSYSTYEDSPASATPWLWAVCGGGCFLNGFDSFSIDTDPPRRVVIFDFEDDDDDQKLVSPSSHIYSI